MRTLLVEDEQDLADAVKAGLDAEGYAVDVAHNGRDGLWFAGQNSYAAMILDVMLPGMKGFKLCAGLRARGDRTPILVLTAKDGELNEIEALDTGADDFLAKPFSYPALYPGRDRDRAHGEGIRHPVPPHAAPGAHREQGGAAGGILGLRVGADGGNVVEVHISAPRRKIDTPFGTDTIRTVRGAGYLVFEPGRDLA